MTWLLHAGTIKDLLVSHLACTSSALCWMMPNMLHVAVSSKRSLIYPLWHSAVYATVGDVQCLWNDIVYLTSELNLFFFKYALCQVDLPLAGWQVPFRIHNKVLLKTWIRSVVAKDINKNLLVPWGELVVGVSFQNICPKKLYVI